MLTEPSPNHWSDHLGNAVWRATSPASGIYIDVGRHPGIADVEPRRKRQRSSSFPWRNRDNNTALGGDEGIVHLMTGLETTKPTSGVRGGTLVGILPD